MQAGSVGLNLVSANNVFIIDPWWNPAVEDQAIERVHRIGQNKDVNVYRFVMKDSVEERMLEIQEKKRGLIQKVIQSQEEKKIGQCSFFAVKICNLHLFCILIILIQTTYCEKFLADYNCFP